MQINLHPEERSDAQMGFRPGRGTDDALAVLECAVSNSIEFNAPLWIVSVDLSKAFDRVEYHALFEAIGQQGVPAPYVSLLRLLYRQQHGLVPGAEPFAVTRGV